MVSHHQHVLMWSITARAYAGYGLLQHECVLSWSITARVCADVVYCSTSVCCHGQLQHECVLMWSIAAQVCAVMVNFSTCVLVMVFLQHLVVLRWFITIRVCAGMVLSSTSVRCHGLHCGTNELVTGILCFLGCPLSPKILLSNETCKWRLIKWYLCCMVHGVVVGWLITYLK